MKKFKTLICGMLVFAMLLSLAACGSEEKKDDSANETAAAVTEETTAEKEIPYEVEDEYLAEFGTLRNRYEALPLPWEIEDPDTYMEKFNEFADIFVGLCELSDKNGETQSLKGLMDKMSDRLEKWVEAGESLSYKKESADRVEFRLEQNEILGKMISALEKLRGVESNENK